MNVFACLVHENPECVLDLVRNLRHLDPDSAVLLYDGGSARQILRSGLPYEAYGAVLFPKAAPQAWGRLHGFALDCMEFALKRWPVETVTIVDSDQLAVGAGYSGYLKRFLAGRGGVGMLGNSTEAIRDPGDIGPARCALEEAALWRPFLRRFPDWESKFPMWTFWPSTVFTADAARALVEIFRDDAELQSLLAKTQIFATEEIFLPTAVALLGFEIAASPCCYDYVKYRVPFTLRDVEHAIARKDVFWMHTVRRELNDPLRLRIRERFLQYRGVKPLEMVLRKSTDPMPDPSMQTADEWISEKEQPLVSCLMPTANRRAFVPRAIQYFQRQSYRNRELIVVDDGEDSVADLIPSDPAIRYVRLEERVTIGEKHNLACSMARGEICLHWDDDDWMADWRIAYQVRELLKHPAMTLSGLDHLYFFEPASNQAWEYSYGNRTPKWVSGATFCYRKRLWESHPFPAMNEGGDTLYVWNLRGVPIVALSDSAFYVATVHVNNTSPKQTQSSGWRAIPSEQVHSLLDEESGEFYRNVGREETAAMEPVTHR